MVFGTNAKETSAKDTRAKDTRAKDTRAKETARTLGTVGPPPTAVREIVRPFAPVAWVYLRADIEGVDERAAQVRHVVWDLEKQGAAAAVLGVVSARLLPAPVGPGAVALFVDADGSVLHEDRLAVGPPADRAGYSLPADVLPVLAADQDRPPYVSVVLDRAGADVRCGTGGGAPERRVVVVGPDDQIEHRASGGWAGLAQSRIQRRATDSWRHNAHRVAEQVAALVEEVAAQAVVVAGDRPSVKSFLDKLSVPPGVLVRAVRGSRHADREQGAAARRLDAALHAVAEEQDRRLFDMFSSRPPGTRVAEGVADTLGALAEGRVDVLLVAPDVESGPVWFGADAREVYPTRELAGFAEREVAVAAAGPVAVRSALLSGGRVRVLPRGSTKVPAEGLGAICR